MLHLVQSAEGRVTAAGIEACARILEISAADVSGVATFYTMYKRRPVGDYHVGVCTNTLCAIMGGDAIFERLKDHLDVGNDETTEDGAITLEHIECNAACDYAPMMTVNWEFMDNMTPESASPSSTTCARARRCARPAAPRSARGARPSGCWPASTTGSPTWARPRSRVAGRARDRARERLDGSPLRRRRRHGRCRRPPRRGPGGRHLACRVGDRGRDLAGRQPARGRARGQGRRRLQARGG